MQLSITSKNRGFALTAILTLALGIGAIELIFSIIWATFLAPVPYPPPEHLVVVWNHRKGEYASISGDELAQLSAEKRTFKRLDFDSLLLVRHTNQDHSEDQAIGLPFPHPGIRNFDGCPADASRPQLAARQK